MSSVEQLKERFSQQAKAGIPFNPVDGVDITGANVERLKVGMETFGWSDYRFVTKEQARDNNWSIKKGADSVRVTMRNADKGSLAEKTLFNAQDVRGMPSLDEMLGMSEVAMRKMRGEVVEISQEDEVAFSPSPIALEKPAIVTLPEAKTHAVNQVEAVSESGELAVMAPYWLDGLHNKQGIELAKQLNELIDEEERALIRNPQSIQKLIDTYPDARLLGLHIVGIEKYRSDELLKANPAEPASLLAGAFVRDKEGAYRPAAGGLVAIQDQGDAVKLKSKAPGAYRASMELAKAKGWTAITLEGKPAKLAEAWLWAAVNGITVANYQPTEQDRARLAKTLKELGLPEQAESAPARQVLQEPKTDVSIQHQKRPEQAPPVAIKQPEPVPEVARLVAHGPAPYLHDKKNGDSYFADLERDGTVKTVWGVDLPRSLEEAGAAIGHEISLQRGGHQVVQVPVLGEAGKQVVTDGVPEMQSVKRAVWTTTNHTLTQQAVRENWDEIIPADTGHHIGPIVAVDGQFICQKTGRDPKQVTWHDAAKMQGDVPTVGKMAEIRYQGGRGHVLGKAQEQGVSR